MSKHEEEEIYAEEVCFTSAVIRHCSRTVVFEKQSNL